MILASWVATYLELYLTGKGYYTLTYQPFSDIFTINILFTLLAIPLLTAIIIRITDEMELGQKVLLLTVISATLTLSEKILGQTKWISFSDQWQHGYSLVGYFLFFFGMTAFFGWLEKEDKHDEE